MPIAAIGVLRLVHLAPGEATGSVIRVKIAELGVAAHVAISILRLARLVELDVFMPEVLLIAVGIHVDL